MQNDGVHHSHMFYDEDDDYCGMGTLYHPQQKMTRHQRMQNDEVLMFHDEDILCDDGWYAPADWRSMGRFYHPQ